MSERTTILVLREECDLSRELGELGYSVFNLPMIETRPVSDLTQFDEKLATVERFDHIFLTSRASAEILADHLTPEIRTKLPVVTVLGSRARDMLENAGVRVKYSEKANTADELLDELGTLELAGSSILFIRGEKSLRTIPERLGQIAEIEEVVVYETVEAPLANDAAVEAIRSGNVAWLCFFSPSAVDSFANRELLNGTATPKAAVIGETTARAARSHGFSVDFISDRATSIDFARGLARHIKSFE